MYIECKFAFVATGSKLNDQSTCVCSRPLNCVHKTDIQLRALTYVCLGVCVGVCVYIHNITQSYIYTIIHVRHTHTHTPASITYLRCKLQQSPHRQTSNDTQNNIRTYDTHTHTHTYIYIYINTKRRNHPLYSLRSPLINNKYNELLHRPPGNI